MMQYLHGNMSFVLAAVFFVFSLGLSGVFISSQNIIGILLSIELMLLAVMLNFLIFSSILHEPSGLVFVLFILTAAASESAVALAIIVSYFRQRKSIEVDAATTVGDKI